MSIPRELRQLKNWSVSLNTEELKRPRHHKYKPNGSFSYETAVKNSTDRLMGFYTTFDDPYVLGDIDHVDNPNNPFAALPMPVAALLQSVDTYSEISPSGNGIRFIIKLPAPELKQTLSGKTFYALGLDPKRKREIQINFGPPWMTITGNETDFSSSEIATVTLEDLELAFDIRYVGDKAEALEEQKVETVQLPEFNEVRKHLMGLALDQNPRIMRAYESVFGHPYAHYDYWMKVMMAINDYAQRSGHMVESLSIFNAWSAQDIEAYQGEEDVTAHWRSLKDKTDKISFKTLFALSKYATLKWPMPKAQTKAEVERGLPKKPLNTEYVNFKALVDFYDVKLWREETDPNVAYVTGDDDIMEKYFQLHKVRPIYEQYHGPLEPTALKSACHVLCQDHGFTGVSHTQVSMFALNYFNYTLRRFHRIKHFFDTPFEELPPEYQENPDTEGKSTIDDILATMDIHYKTPAPTEEHKLYRRYLEIWIMSFVRGLYYQDSIHRSPCVLLLTGPESIRKTSFFRMMFPKFMRKFNVITPHGFVTLNDIRDNTKLAATNNLVIMDEFEKYLVADSEAGLKKLVEGDPQTFIDKYDKTPTTVVPRAIFGATSNMSTFNLSDEGSRRLFHIPVKWVDTDGLNTINWHTIINDTRAKIQAAFHKGQIPWTMNENELSYQRSLHQHLRAKTNLDIILCEIFDFDHTLDGELYRNVIRRGSVPGLTSFQRDTTGRVMTTKEVHATIAAAGHQTLTLKRPALIKTLERLCSEFTGTGRQPLNISKPKLVIHRGEATQNGRRKWVMPPAFDSDVLVHLRRK